MVMADTVPENWKKIPDSEIDGDDNSWKKNRSPRSDHFSDFVPDWIRDELEGKTLPVALLTVILVQSASKLDAENKHTFVQQFVNFSPKHGGDIDKFTLSVVNSVETGELPLSNFTGGANINYVAVLAGAASATEDKKFEPAFKKALTENISSPTSVIKSSSDGPKLKETLTKWGEYLDTRQKIRDI